MMKKYNKNLYYYAKLNVTDDGWYNSVKLQKGISTALILSYVYLFIMSGMTFIADLVVYSNVNNSNRTLVKANAVWMGVTVAAIIISFVFFCLKRQYEAAGFGLVAAVSNVVSNIDLYSGKHLIFRYILPSILVLIFVAVYAVVLTLKKASIHKEYMKLSNRLYKAASSADGEIGVNSRLLEKMMDEYDGKEIKIPNKKR